MSDEGLHEFQLNGKQLVFLFMTATVVAVVIFLCGVMVGRGVQAPGPQTVIAESVDPTASVQTPAAPAASPPSSSASASSGETLKYPELLEDPTPIDEFPPDTRRATASTTQAPPPLAPASASAPRPATPSPSRTPASAPRAAAPMRTAPAAPAASSEPAGSGFVVQVAAVRQRAEADTIQKRLAGKGYPAFVTTPGSTGPAVFRVRVGKYESRREAESVAGRLEREEQFKPWITR